MIAQVADRRARAVTALDAWIFVPGPAGRVRTMRLLLAALIALRVALGPYRGLAGQPAALFRPVWFLSWLPNMPSVEVIVAAAGRGHRRRRAGGPRVAGAGDLPRRVDEPPRARRTAGEPGQGDAQRRAAPPRRGGDRARPVGVRALDRRRRADGGWPVQTALLVVGGAYFLTGFQKLVASGPAWVLSDNLRNVMYRAAETGKAPTDAVALFIADRPLVAHLVALATITVELSALAILRWARLRPWFLLAITVMHVGIYLTHGLDYWAWIATTAIVLVDWSAVAARRLPRAAAEDQG